MRVHGRVGRLVKLRLRILHLDGMPDHLHEMWCPYQIHQFHL